MDTNQQINALVERFGLSETVKQDIIKIVKKACDDAYDKGREDFYDEIRMRLVYGIRRTNKTNCK